MSRDVVYTFHLWPPLAHARHYTGTAREHRLARRFTDHALGRGARMLQVQVERGGSWVLGNLQPGGWERERELKDMHKGSRHCDVCKAVSGYQAGRLDTEQALAQAGWDRASEHERSLLAEIFGLESAPGKVPEKAPEPARAESGPYPGPAPVSSSPEIDALVDALIESWSPKAEAEQGPQPEADQRPGHFPGRGATPQTDREVEASA